MKEVYIIGFYCRMWRGQIYIIMKFLLSIFLSCQNNHSPNFYLNYTLIFPENGDNSTHDMFKMSRMKNVEEGR